MSETNKATLFAALAKAQANFEPVHKSSTANAGSYKYNYATLDIVLAAITPALSAEGLCRWWTTKVEERVVTVEARIGFAESGESVFSALSWPVPDDIQDFGGVLTYLRRYTIQAVAGVAPDEDNDGAGLPPAPNPGSKAVTPKNAAKTQAALDKGKANQDDEATIKFGEALASIRWTLADFKAELVDYAGIKVPRSLDKPYAQWADWQKVKARELYEKIRAGDGNGPLPEPTPPEPTLPPEEEMPF